MTPLETLIEYAKVHYSDDLSYDSKDILTKAIELLEQERLYLAKREELAYDHGYETGLRVNVARTYDS